MAFVRLAAVVFLFLLLIGHLISQWDVHIFSSLNQQRFAIITYQGGFHAQFRVSQFGHIYEVNFLTKPTGTFGMVSAYCATFSVTFDLTSTYTGYPISNRRK